MKAKEIRELSNEQLQDKLKELNLRLFNDRFSMALGTLEKPAVIRASRKDIARIQTVLAERGVRV